MMRAIEQLPHEDECYCLACGQPISKEADATQHLLFERFGGLYAAHSHEHECEYAHPHSERCRCVCGAVAWPREPWAGGTPPLPIKIDPSVPSGEIHFRYNGKTVGKIVNIEGNNAATPEVPQD